MATNPEDIKLSLEERLRLAKIADQRGEQWTDTFEDLLDSAEARLGIERGLRSARNGEGISARNVHDKLRKDYQLD